MSDIKNISVSTPGVPSYTINHEASTEPNYQPMSVENAAGRVDGNGVPIVETKVVPKQLELPSCIHNKSIDTMGLVDQTLLSGQKSTMVVTHRDGTFSTYYDAIFVGEMKYNSMKSTFNATIQGNIKSKTIK